MVPTCAGGSVDFRTSGYPSRKWEPSTLLFNLSAISKPLNFFQFPANQKKDGPHFACTTARWGPSEQRPCAKERWFPPVRGNTPDFCISGYSGYPSRKWEPSTLLFNLSAISKPLNFFQFPANQKKDGPHFSRTTARWGPSEQRQCARERWFPPVRGNAPDFCTSG